MELFLLIANFYHGATYTVNVVCVSYDRVTSLHHRNTELILSGVSSDDGRCIGSRGDLSRPIISATLIQRIRP